MLYCVVMGQLSKIESDLKFLAKKVSYSTKETVPINTLPNNPDF